jgi:hypothetical protein
MTTDGQLLPRRTLPFRAAILSALGCWFGAVLLLTLLFEPTRDVFVIGLPTDLAGLSEADVMLVDSIRDVPRVRSDRPGFVMRLYAQGAWLVIPASQGGCRQKPPPATVSGAKQEQPEPPRA